MVTVHIDHERLTEKPDDTYLKKIGNRITKYKETYNIAELADIVGNKGCSFLPAIMNGRRKEEFFIEQQVFGLDFDGTITVEELMERSAEAGIYPAFIYKTLNYREDDKRIRAIYVNDCVFSSNISATVVRHLLLYLFPEADKQCKDAARFFLGGKELIYLDETAKINVMDLAIAVQMFMRKKDPKNYIRKMQQIEEKTGVKLVEGVLRILTDDDLSEIEKSEESRVNPYLILMGETPNSSKRYYFEKKETPDQYVREQRKVDIKQIQHKEIKDIISVCSLFRDHYSKDLDHGHKFLLATSLFHIKGGKKMFFDGLPDHHKKWEAAWDTIKVNHYFPMSCVNGDCPYAGKCRCHSLYEKLQRKIQLKEQTEYVPLEEAQERLRKAVYEAVYSQNKDLYLIKAQTSLGKTYTYSQMLLDRSSYEKPVLIAVTTNNLQQEVYKSLRDSGIEVRCSLNKASILKKYGEFELVEMIQELYAKGRGKKVNQILREHIKSGNAGIFEKAELEEVLNGITVFDGTTHVVTTHKMLLQLPKVILNQYEVIVDEDILMTLFKDTGSISFYELKQALESDVLNIQNRHRIYEILQSEDGFIGNSNMRSLSDEALDVFYEENSNFTGTLQDFLSSRVFMTDKKTEVVHYFKYGELPNVPMTIVSATLNKKLYDDYFRYRKIQYLEIPVTAYKGKLIQYTACSMSRKCIDKIGFENVKRSVDKITGDPDLKMITFRRFEEESDIYIGKTEGVNKYKGKDLCVVGTPHSVPFIYRLIGKSLGYDAYSNMNTYRVENEKAYFSLMTFADQDMRELQMYFLESELEQAVGRARLLRFDCTVYLFSNYPLLQAEIIQDDYIVE